jgi:hypothetical protein
MDFSGRCSEDLGATLRLLEAHNVGSVGHRPGIGGALSPTKQARYWCAGLTSIFATENEERGEDAASSYGRYLRKTEFPGREEMRHIASWYQGDNLVRRVR